MTVDSSCDVNSISSELEIGLLCTPGPLLILGVLKTEDSFLITDPDPSPKLAYRRWQWELDSQYDEKV